MTLSLINVISCTKIDESDSKGINNSLSIHRILPNVAAVASFITIEGQGFGTDKNSAKVMFGDQSLEILEWSTNVLKVQVPAIEQGSKVLVSVLVNGAKSNEQYFRIRNLNEVTIEPKDTIEWIEHKSPNIAAVEHGVVSYDEQVIKYIRSGSQLLEIDMGKPVLVSVADREYDWGFYNFPNIQRSLSGQLAVNWAMNHDAASSYGMPSQGIRDAVSNDGGQTWTTLSKGPTSGGNLLSNGDRIAIGTPKAVPLEELNLPNPIAVLQEAYGRTFRIYEYDKLPAQLQGTYQSRMKKGQTNYVGERGTLVHSKLARYADGNLFPVVWWGDIQETTDGVYTGTYPAFEVNAAGKVDPSGVFFYKSTDFGKTWVKQGSIPYQPDLALDPNGDKRYALGWTEPAFAILKNGAFLSVLRTQDGFGKSPMYVTTSTNKGTVWSKPKVFTGAGVLPKLLELDNGVVALSSGRPGVQIRFMLNNDADDWTQPIELLPWIENEAQLTDIQKGSSCGYTSMVKVDDNSFLIVYADFKYKTAEGLTRKAIKVRKVTVKKI